MPTEVRLPTLLRQYCDGQAVVKAEGSTIGELLKDLESQYPGMQGQLTEADGTLRKFVNVYLNDDDVRFLDGVNTKIQSGDEVSILPAVAGGT
jgi:molybdopterin synthase sulfur carrier subunit